MEIRTHHALDRELCGTPEAIAEGTATVSMTATDRMQADATGLVHGGFVFGLADHAAMLAINEPTVVLGASELRFLAPVTVGQRIVAKATVAERKAPDAEGVGQARPPRKTKKHLVDVEARVGDTVVLTGRLTCFVPPTHVLAPKPNPTPQQQTP